MQGLVDVYQYALAHCCEWLVSQATLSTYSINKWMIGPVTREPISAMAEHLSCKKLLPTWFISHYWGELASDLLKSIKYQADVRSLSSNLTFYWISAYSQRQHEVQSDIYPDFRQSSFFKAMRTANFKVLLVVNLSTGSALSRLWCLFECLMCCDRCSQVLDLAGCGAEQIELLTTGLTTAEVLAHTYYPGRGHSAKVRRESTFPTELARTVMALDVTKLASGQREDKARILNCIAGQPLGDEPLEEHDRYYEASRRIRGLLAGVFWHRAMAECPSPHDMKKHRAFLEELAKVIKGDWWKKCLSIFVGGCSMDDPDMVDLVVQCIPPNLVRLKLDFQHSGLESHSFTGLPQVLPKSLQELSIDVSGCKGISNACVTTFLKQLPDHMQKLELGLAETKVSPGLVMLSKDPLVTMRKWADSTPAEMEGILVAKIASTSQTALNNLAAVQVENDRKVALENMLLLAPAKLHGHVRDRIKADLALLEETKTIPPDV